MSGGLCQNLEGLSQINNTNLDEIDKLENRLNVVIENDKK